jgi:hypothetical protein
MNNFNHNNNTFQEGAVVYAKNNLQLELCIRRYVNDFITGKFHNTHV